VWAYRIELALQLGGLIRLRWIAQNARSARPRGVIRHATPRHATQEHTIAGIVVMASQGRIKMHDGLRWRASTAVGCRRSNARILGAGVCLRRAGNVDQLVDVEVRHPLRAALWLLIPASYPRNWDEVARVVDEMQRLTRYARAQPDAHTVDTPRNRPHLLKVFPT
jgi:hypothetical protein